MESSLIPFQFDDGGREASGFRGRAGDCVVRSACILTGRPYREIYDRAAALNRENGARSRSARNGVRTKAYQRLFAELGLVKVKLPKGEKPTFTEAHRRYGDCLVSTTRHISAVVDGSVRDTSDCRTYQWEDEEGRRIRKERKAQSIWIRGEEARSA